MEHFLHFLTDVRFEYSTERPDRITLGVVRKKQEVDAARAAWVKTACALVHTRKYPTHDRYLWLRLSTSFLAADRVSCFAHPTQISKCMLHKDAAEYYEEEAGELREELMRARRGRRRFPHHWTLR